MPTPDVRVTRDDTNDTFPYSGTRVLGAVQINIGILVFVLGIVDLILTMSTHTSDRQKYGSRYETVVSMTVVSSPLWCGLWYSIAGGLGACLTRDRASTVVYCKIACLLINILCCALFGPVCAVITGYISYTRHNLARGDYQWLISLMVCFLAVIQVILSTVSASVTCCCSTVRSTQVHVFVNSRRLRETENQQHSNSKSSCSPSHVDISNISHNNVKNNSSSNEIDENLHSKSGNSSTLEDNDNHHNSRKNSSPSNEISNSHNSISNLSTKKMRANTPLIPSHIVDRQTAVNNVNENDYTKPVRASLQEESEKDIQYSSSYLALKKWALPRQ